VRRRGSTESSATDTAAKEVRAEPVAARSVKRSDRALKTRILTAETHDLLWLFLAAYMPFHSGSSAPKARDYYSFWIVHLYFSSFFFERDGIKFSRFFKTRRRACSSKAISCGFSSHSPPSSQSFGPSALRSPRAPRLEGDRSGRVNFAHPHSGFCPCCGSDRKTRFSIFLSGSFLFGPAHIGFRHFTDVNRTLPQSVTTCPVVLLRRVLRASKELKVTSDPSRGTPPFHSRAFRMYAARLA